MNQTVTFLLFFFCQFISSAQNQVEKTFNHGVLDGEYISHYSNGKVKANGFFDNNKRAGEWKLWDEAGNIRMVRNYSDYNSYEILVAKTKEGVTIDSLQGLKHNEQKKDNGHYSYWKVQEKDVLMSKRIWREVVNTEMNQQLFENERFYSILLNNILDTVMNGYATDNDEFKTIIDVDSLRKCADNAKLHHYKIKEDWFYDRSRQLAETRIIGICLVVEKEGEVFDLVWAYFPHVREMKDWDKDLDEMFFTRNFNSKIVKEGNVHDKELSEYTEDLEAERMNIEANLIEHEHDLWLMSLE